MYRPRCRRQGGAFDPVAFIDGRRGPGASDLYAEVDRPFLARVLEYTGGNQNQAARLLGIARHTLHLKLRDLGQPVTHSVQAGDNQSESCPAEYNSLAPGPSLGSWFGSRHAGPVSVEWSPCRAPAWRIDEPEAARFGLRAVPRHVDSSGCETRPVTGRSNR
jgi:hypothetical protein